MEEINQKFMDGESDFEYQKRYDRCMSILREKEEICDVKVADFIEANIREFKLFLTQNHPTTQVYIHCVNQIIKILGIDKFFRNDPHLDPNIADLPGHFLHSTYDVRFWKFKYIVPCFDQFWGYHIGKI